jgi:hypothetical protein
MNCYLTTGFIIILILLLGFGNDDDDDGRNEIMFSHHLRGMYNEEKENYIEDMINLSYNGVYSAVIEKAKSGKNEYYFTLYCREKRVEPLDYCIKYDGYQEWLNSKDGILKYNIQPTNVSIRIINKLKEVFPDSNIITHNKNCCDYYKIYW